ncbi:XkdX family protein [Listeria monocytogenes]|nr:XkdX family protein [Listeria monocytogenes]EDN9846494.1 XkdX family protein [Listeria monocytogenes]
MSESWYQIASLYFSIGFDIRWIVDGGGITSEEYEEITGEPFM